MRYLLIGVLLSFYCLPWASSGQVAPPASTTAVIVNFPSRFFQKVNEQAAGMDQKITRQSEKYLQRLAKKEAQLRKRMFQQDSAAAKRIFGNNPLDYTALLQKLQGQRSAVTGGPAAAAFSATSGTTYLPSPPSPTTPLKPPHHTTH